MALPMIVKCVKQFVEKLEVPERYLTVTVDTEGLEEHKVPHNHMVLRVSVEKLILQLQDVLEKIKSQRSDQNVKNSSADTTDLCDKSADDMDVTVTEWDRIACGPVTESDKTACTSIDPNLVQIKANKDEIDRRIAAFIQRKQNDLDETNRREFCNIVSPANSEDFPPASCARTDAVFIPRTGCSSHVKVSRAVNPYGPQTSLRPAHVTRDIKTERAVKQEPCTSAVEERIKNMEAHLNMDSGQTKQAALFQTLKNLEERILFLESLSPEYFNKIPPHKKHRSERVIKDEPGAYNINSRAGMPIADIDDKIRTLQERLRRKAAGLA